MASDSLYSHDTILKRDDPNRKQRAAFARTLRNAAGGPPTDARRAQAEAVKAEVYLAIAKFALAIQGTTAQITQRRGNQSLGKIHKALPTPHAHADDEERRPVKSAALRSLFDRPPQYNW